MALRIMVSGNQSHHPFYKEYELELRSEVELLPKSDSEAAFGSKAFCTEDSSLWTKTSSGEWKELV